MKLIYWTFRQPMIASSVNDCNSLQYMSVLLNLFQWWHVSQWCVHHLYNGNWENQSWRRSGYFPDSQGSKSTETTHGQHQRELLLAVIQCHPRIYTYHWFYENSHNQLTPVCATYNSHTKSTRVTAPSSLEVREQLVFVQPSVPWSSFANTCNNEVQRFARHRLHQVWLARPSWLSQWHLPHHQCILGWSNNPD